MTDHVGPKGKSTEVQTEYTGFQSGESISHTKLLSISKVETGIEFSVWETL